MRVKFKLDGEPKMSSVFEAGLITKEFYDNSKWVLTYSNLNTKELYYLVTIVPYEVVADVFIQKALEDGYIDVSDYKTVDIKDLDEED